MAETNKEAVVKYDNSSVTVNSVIDFIHSRFGSAPPRQVMTKLLRESPATQDLYFVSDGEFVKIGKARNIKERFYNLQIANPRPLKIIGFVEYGGDLEKGYHQRFAEYHIRGEWFELSPEILEEIEFIYTAQEQALLRFADNEDIITGFMEQQFNAIKKRLINDQITI